MSFSLAFHSSHVPTTTTAVSAKVTRKYSHSHAEYTRPSRLLLKLKNVVLKNVAVNVAGRKKIVIAAITRMTALSRDVAMETSWEASASFVLVAARRRLMAESRCAIPLYT